MSAQKYLLDDIPYDLLLAELDLDLYDESEEDE